MNNLIINNYLLSNDGWALILLAICIVPIAILIIFAIVKSIMKARKKQKEQENSEGVDEEQRAIFLNAYGGSENIESVSIERQKITVVVKDIEKVQGEELKNLGATGVLLLGNEVRASFSDRAESVYNLIK